MNAELQASRVGQLSFYDSVNWESAGVIQKLKLGIHGQLFFLFNRFLHPHKQGRWENPLQRPLLLSEYTEQWLQSLIKDSFPTGLFVRSWSNDILLLNRDGQTLIEIRLFVLSIVILIPQFFCAVITTCLYYTTSLC